MCNFNEYIRNQTIQKEIFKSDEYQLMNNG